MGDDEISARKLMHSQAIYRCALQVRVSLNWLLALHQWNRGLARAAAKVSEIRDCWTECSVVPQPPG
jgi:hypothetical protein